MSDEANLAGFSDEQLASMASLHPAACAELYQRHVRRIYRYILLRVGSVHDAQDLTGQTFEVMLQAIRHYRGEGVFAAWLTIIARNVTADHYRARRVELPLESIADNLASNGIDEVVSQRLRMALVREALAELSAEYAEVVRLRIFGALSTSETAAVMGKSEAAVKMLLHRALRDLRKRIGLEQMDEVER